MFMPFFRSRIGRRPTGFAQPVNLSTIRLYSGIDPWRGQAPSTRTFESNPSQELTVEFEAIAGLRDPDVAGK
jgi:hypothetical protein